MNSLAVTDGLLFVCAAYLAWMRHSTVGIRLAYGVIAVAALLGTLKFSGLYPLEAWHHLFSIFAGSAALPLLAVAVISPRSAVATDRQLALIFLGAAALLGLAIAGLGQLRIYDRALATISLLGMLAWTVKQSQWQRSAGLVLMLVGSVLYVAEVELAAELSPGDYLHLGMAVGILLLSSWYRPQPLTQLAQQTPHGPERS
jgi:hypothetical protein